MKKLILAAIILTSGTAMAQAIVSSENVTVQNVDCAVNKQGSITGAATGAAVGAGVASLFTKSPLGWAVSGLAGAAVGNSVGSNKFYQCSVIVNNGKNNLVVNYAGSTQPVVGTKRVVNVLQNGQVMLQ